MATKEWKIRDKEKFEIIDEVYALIDNELGDISSINDHKKDIRLVCHEWFKNILDHDQRAMRVRFEIESRNNRIDVGISHDGDQFDPLDEKSNCEFIKKIAHRLNIKPTKTTMTDSKPMVRMRFSIEL